VIYFTDFCDNVIRVNEVGQPFKLTEHQRVTFDTADELRDDWNQFLYSTIKKSGKTTLNAGYCIKWALEHPDDELIVQANDFEQATGRVFTAIVKLCDKNKIRCRVLSDRIIFPNGSVIRAIASDFAGEAGASQGFHSCDEPWGCVSENAIRLLEELTPILTKPSIRFISTYAGWLNQSKWLWDFYLQAVGKDQHPQGQARYVSNKLDLPLYLNRDAGIFCYWDSGVEARRMPWQQGPKADRYYEQQRRNLRAGAFARLHLNQWGSGDDRFIDEAMWQAITDDELSPVTEGAVGCFGGWDASTKRDSTAVVFVAWEGNKIRVVNHRIFKPSFLKPVDFQLVEDYVREIVAKNHVVRIFADPHQLFSTIQKLQKEGYPVVEFLQTIPNLTVMAGNLFDAFNTNTLRTYPAKDLKEHALNAIAVETPRGYTIKKERSAGKIDGLVALGMALTCAVQQGKSSNVLAWSGGMRVASMRDWVDQGGMNIPTDREPAPGTVTVHIGGIGRVGGRFDWGN
jgi:phage terminase large subunit-like protein